MSTAKISTVPTGKGCLPWLASKNKTNGYGEFKVREGKFVSTRISYFLHYGIDPGELCVLHSCDDPSCANPLHLSLGTHQDNMVDRGSKGRTASGDRSGARTKPERLARGDRSGARLHPESRPRGEKSYNSKLTDFDILVIRADPRTHRAIAADYGMAHTGIGCIKRGQTWRHVAPETINPTQLL